MGICLATHVYFQDPSQMKQSIAVGVCQLVYACHGCLPAHIQSCSLALPVSNQRGNHRWKKTWKIHADVSWCSHVCKSAGSVFCPHQLQAVSTPPNFTTNPLTAALSVLLAWPIKQYAAVDWSCSKAWRTTCCKRVEGCLPKDQHRLQIQHTPMQYIVT